MNSDARCKVFHAEIPAIFVLLFIVMIFPLTAFSHPTGTMGRQMMDEETREKMMEEGGYRYGPGYGRMGNMMGSGYGPMMGGGPGWMGNMMGGGYGPAMGGMMGMMGGFYQLDLSKDQRDNIRDIQFSMHKENFGLMDKMMDRSSKLAKLYDSEKLNLGKIGRAYDEFFKVKREMIMRHVEARNEMYRVLNKEQRKQFRSYGSSGHMGMMMH